MKPAVLLFFTVVTIPAFADTPASVSFDERVSMAKMAEDDERFHPYPEQMAKDAGRRLARTMRKCWSQSSGQDRKPFVLVAEIQRDGRPRDVAVKPAHVTARCFEAGFSSNRYLPPPEYPDRDGFPIVMRIGGR